MNICLIDNCTLSARSRGLCEKHYAYHYRHGTLDAVAASANGVRKRLPRNVPGQHSLTDIDTENKSATCSVCGTTDVRLSGSLWRCGNKTREVSRNHAKRSNRKSQMTYRYGDGEKVPYALAASERIRLREEQQDRCAICGTYSESLHLDHCHVNGDIRGLLCASCNIGLGHFTDDPEKLKAAIEYLTR